MQLSHLLYDATTNISSVSLPPSPQFGSPYASVPLTYSPYLPGLVSPLLQGGEQLQGGLQQSPPPLQHPQQPQQLPQQQKQRSDRIEVSQPSDLSPVLRQNQANSEEYKKTRVKVTILASLLLSGGKV